MNKEEKLLYDAAIAEVRGEEDPYQKRELEADPHAWRTALHQVLDEIDSQKEFKKATLETTRELQGDDSRAYLLGREELIAWQEKVGVFRKYISARLAHVDRICKENPKSLNVVSGKDASITEKLKTLAAAVNDYSDEDDEWFDAVDDLLDYIETL